MTVQSLTDLQMDAIREVCNIASGTAAVTLSQILGKRIDMKVPEIQIVPIEQATAVMGNTASIVAGIYSKLLGDINGGLLLTFPREDVLLLTERLMVDPVKPHSLSDLDASAVCEIGNIISAAFVSAIAKMANKTLLISVPKLSIDMLGAIVDFILIELAEQVEQALILKIEFEDVPKTISGHFFILPNPGSLEMLLAGMDMMCADKSQGNKEHLA